MAEYKLVYFNVMGLGEPIRFILSYAGVEFEDVRVFSLTDEWLKMKSSKYEISPRSNVSLRGSLRNVIFVFFFTATPFGQLPMLEMGGKIYTQSLPICRYLAKQFNLAGSTDLDNLQIDAIAHAIYDFRISKYRLPRREKSFLSTDVLP